MDLPAMCLVFKNIFQLIKMPNNSSKSYSVEYFIFQMLLRNSDTDLETMTRIHKQTLDKTLTAQAAECRAMQKKVKAQQVSRLLTYLTSWLLTYVTSIALCFGIHFDKRTRIENINCKTLSIVKHYQL